MADRRHSFIMSVSLRKSILKNIEVGDLYIRLLVAALWLEVVFWSEVVRIFYFRRNNKRNPVNRCTLPLYNTRLQIQLDACGGKLCCWAVSVLFAAVILSLLSSSSTSDYVQSLRSRVVVSCIVREPTAWEIAVNISPRRSIESDDARAAYVAQHLPTKCVTCRIDDFDVCIVTICRYAHGAIGTWGNYRWFAVQKYVHSTIVWRAIDSRWKWVLLVTQNLRDSLLVSWAKSLIASQRQFLV